MYKATDNPYLSALADGWLADGFVAVVPTAEIRPFGYHRRMDKDELEVVPCPNCDAPNERSQFLRPDWQFGAKSYYAEPVIERIEWLKSPEGQALCREIGSARAWQFDGVHILDHPSRYETTTCKRCGCEVVIPGGYLNWLCAKAKDRWAWYYKPCPLPPPIEYDIEGQLNAPVWMKYRWSSGKIVEELHKTGIRLNEMIQNHFTVNIFTGSVAFFVGWTVDHWGQVHLVNHKDNLILTDGHWSPPEFSVPEQDTIYDPIHRQRNIFVLDRCYLGDALPPDEQVKVLVAGLTREPEHRFDALAGCIAHYVSERHLGVDLTYIIRQARFERERKRLAVLRSQKGGKASDDARQKTLF